MANFSIALTRVMSAASEFPTLNKYIAVQAKFKDAPGFTDMFCDSAAELGFVRAYYNAARAHKKKPKICQFFNTPIGQRQGCTNADCRRQHCCVLCKRTTHGAFEVKRDGSYRCPFHAVFWRELTALELSLDDLDNEVVPLYREQLQRSTSWVCQPCGRHNAPARTHCLNAQCKAPRQAVTAPRAVPQNASPQPPARPRASTPPSPSPTLLPTPLLRPEVALLEDNPLRADQTQRHVALPGDLPPSYSPPGVHSSPTFSASSTSSVSMPPSPPYSPPDTPPRSPAFAPRQLSIDPLSQLLPTALAPLPTPPPVYTPPTPVAAAPMSSRQASLLCAAPAAQSADDDEEEAQLHSLLLKAITAQTINRQCTPTELAAKAQHAWTRFVQEEVTSVEILRELNGSHYKECGLSIGLMLAVQRTLRVA
jgi:hypothetical protein